MEEEIKSDQLETKIVIDFTEKYLKKMEALLKIQSYLRVYAFEFPITYKEEKGRVDLILEVMNDEHKWLSNPLIVMEFKKNKIKYGPIDQLNFYLKEVGGRLYRKNVIGFLAATEFSEHEIEECKKAKHHCLQFDFNGNLRLLC